MTNISVRGRALGLAVMAGAGFASLALAGPVGASANRVAAAKTVKYNASCTNSVNHKATNYPVSVTTNAPATVASGKPVSLAGAQYSVTVPGSLVKLARSFNFTSASGTVTALNISASDAKAGTGTQNLAKKAIKFGPVALTKSEETTGLTVKLPATPSTLGGFVSGTKGTMKFTPGTVTLTATFKGPGGSLPVTVTCKSSTTVVNSTTVS